jgi:RNA polymerase sigma-70 factor, ECF subfamily
MTFAPVSMSTIARNGMDISLRRNDLELVQRIRSGDKAAFQELVSLYSDDLFGLAYSLLGNAADAEDALQQTLLGAFSRIDSFEGRSSLNTWLVRILYNQASKLRRYRRVRRMAPIDTRDGTVEGGPTPRSESTAAAVDSKVDLTAMLEELSPEHREILVLRELERMSYDELAETLKIPRGTVESRLFRARQELRRRHEGYFS